MSDDRYQVTDPRFSSDFDRPQRPSRPRSAWSGCVIGCLVLLGIFLLLAVFATVWTVRNWRGWMATAVSMGIKMSIDETDLPRVEKDAIHEQVDRVADAFRDGRLTGEQTIMILERLVKSPVITILAVTAAERQYFDQSDLTNEEKEAGRRTLQRFLRGAFDGDIGRGAIDEVLQPIAEPQSDGGWRLRRRVSDDELRAFLSNAQRMADEAGVPAEPEMASPSAEFKRIVDEALEQGE